LSAKSVAWLNNAANWGDGSGKVSAGDTVHLCGVITQTVYVLGNGAPGNPVTIRFEPGAKLSSPAWDSSRGGLYAKGVQFVVIDGAGAGIIENTANGTALANHVASVGLFLHDCRNCEVKNLSVLNIYQRTPGSADANRVGLSIVLSGDSSNSSVHDCAVSNAWKGINIAYSVNKSSNVSVYNNSIKKTAVGIVIGSSGADALAEAIKVYNNRIDENYVWDGLYTTPTGTTGWHHADGIHAFSTHLGSSLNGVNIYNNEIGPNLGTHVTSWIYAADPRTTNVNIYNNLLTATGSSYPSNGYIGIRFAKFVNIYNNTIIGSGKGNGVGLWSGAANVNVRNNIFSQIYRPYIGIAAFDTSSLIASDDNCFNGPIQNHYQGRTYTLADWQSSLGFDRNSITSDPLLMTNYHPASGSPVRGRGDNLGSPFDVDKAGVVRPYTGWTLGVYQ